MNNLMAQAQRMQKDIERKQQEIYGTEYTGSSELVDVILTGDKKLKSVKFKKMENFDADDLDILEDMVKIAFNDAVTKIERDIESKLGMYGKQLGGLI
jgi:DNA-binding protein, ybaB/ebfC family